MNEKIGRMEGKELKSGRETKRRGAILNIEPKEMLNAECRILN